MLDWVGHELGQGGDGMGWVEDDMSWTGMGVKWVVLGLGMWIGWDGME